MMKENIESLIYSICQNQNFKIKLIIRHSCVEVAKVVLHVV